MKIAILTLGTRGDVQPYAVLGKALKQRGHEVTISTAKNFEQLIRSYNLDFVPVEADFQALLNSEEGNKIRKNPFLAKKYMKQFVYPMMADAFTTFYALAMQSDRVLFHIKTMADNFADQFPEKMIKADLIPASQSTRAFPNPVFAALPLPKFLNRFTYKLTDWALKMWQKPVNDFRKNTGLPEKFRKPAIPSIYAISNLFLPKPADYPTNIHFTGFWTDVSNQDLSKDILDFIKVGEPPVLITFGSMPFDSKLNLLELIQYVIDKTDVRLIIIKGWGLSDTSEIELIPRIKVIESAPYDKLIPLVKAVIHHGGIGTISHCLNAGKPFLTCPVLYPLGDQYFWGTIAYQKGVGLKPIPLKKLRKELLVKSIRELRTNKSMEETAQRLSVKLKGEDGIVKAIEIIENNPQ